MAIIEKRTAKGWREWVWCIVDDDGKVYPFMQELEDAEYAKTEMERNPIRHGYVSDASFRFREVPDAE